MNENKYLRQFVNKCKKEFDLLEEKAGSCRNIDQLRDKQRELEQAIELVEFLLAGEDLRTEYAKLEVKLHEIRREIENEQR